MVYCGKPSMGCETCRKRRIKCDETKPVCNQCIKSRRHCSGYRSAFDILHRDETHATKSRAKKAEAKKAAKRAAEGGGGFAIIEFDDATDQDIKRETSPPIISPTTSAASSSLSSSSSALTSPVSTLASTNTSPLEMVFPPAPTAAPAVPLGQHASHYFASHFIMLPGQRKNRRGHLDYLIPFLQSETDPNSSFQLAYSACGLAAMSNREKSNNTNLTAAAFLQHTRALRAISAALQDPVRCKTDATLASVQLLCFFEKITATQETGLAAWRTHSEGAIHIVRERGRETNRGQYSVKLFNAVRLDIIARTLSSGTAPAGGADWWLQESDLEDSTGPRFQRFALEISDMRVEVTRLMTVLPHNEQGIDIMLEMLKKIHDLDRKIANWLATLPEDYNYSALYWEDNVQGPLKDAPVFPGRVDQYHDIVAASMLNGVRASRIILASILIRVAAWICSPADYRTTPEYSTAVRTIRTNISDIVSSVPFMMSTLAGPGRHHPSVRGVVAGNFLCGADEQAKMVGGLMASWPLSTIKTCDYTTDEQREWAAGRLNSIANDLGIKYASTLANARIRFPSMLISRDGLMAANDPLKNYKATLATRPIPVR